MHALSRRLLFIFFLLLTHRIMSSLFFVDFCLLSLDADIFTLFARLNMLSHEWRMHRNVMNNSDWLVFHDLQTSRLDWFPVTQNNIFHSKLRLHFGQFSAQNCFSRHFSRSARAHGACQNNIKMCANASQCLSSAKKRACVLLLATTNEFEENS